MKQKWSVIIGIVVFALVLAGGTIAYNHVRFNGDEKILYSETPPTNGQNRTAALDFTMTDIDGNSLRLSDKFGTPIVLNFWASWCPPCRQEKPDFETVYQDLGNDVSFVIVNLVGSRGETVESGMQYINEQGFTFPVYFDTEQEGSAAYEITSIPTTIFIDRDSMIAATISGPLNENRLRQQIDLIR